jgi:hypothetical protein
MRCLFQEIHLFNSRAVVMHYVSAFCAMPLWILHAVHLRFFYAAERRYRFPAVSIKYSVNCCQCLIIWIIFLRHQGNFRHHQVICEYTHFPVFSSISTEYYSHYFSHTFFGGTLHSNYVYYGRRVETGKWGKKKCGKLIKLFFLMKLVTPSSLCSEVYFLYNDLNFVFLHLR